MKAGHFGLQAVHVGFELKLFGLQFGADTIGSVIMVHLDPEHGKQPFFAFLQIEVVRQVTGARLVVLEGQVVGRPGTFR